MRRHNTFPFPWFQSAQVPGPIDAVLETASSNVDLAEKLLGERTITIGSSAAHETFRTGDHQAGNIAVFNKLSREIDYLYLRGEYPALISYPEQTPESRERFWISRMAEATTLGFQVALLDPTKDK